MIFHLNKRTKKIKNLLINDFNYKNLKIKKPLVASLVRSPASRPTVKIINEVIIKEIIISFLFFMLILNFLL